ncbi:MAG: hypothetical protein ACR2NN_02195 [Bryobacteraceae bacterium]
MIFATVGGYTFMHAVFFGVPHFTLTTAMGKAEISMAVSNLVLLGFGIWGVSRGIKDRRAQDLTA